MLSKLLVPVCQIMNPVSEKIIWTRPDPDLQPWIKI